MQKSLLRTLFKRIRGEPYAVTYWDGQTEVYGDEGKQAPVVRLVIKENLPVAEMLCELEVKFGEAYMEGKIDFEGDL